MLRSSGVKSNRRQFGVVNAVICSCPCSWLSVTVKTWDRRNVIGYSMELRARIMAEMKQAMKDKATARLSTIRLISAAIKDRDIAVRADGNHDGVDDTEVLAILGKMVRQRQESARTYEEASRLDLSERELSEIIVIQEFLPRQLNAEEVAAVVEQTISEVGASSIRDMGRVMGLLKSQYTGQMDFGSVGPIVKSKLSS